MHTYTTRLYDPSLAGYIESEHITELDPAQFAHEIAAELPTIKGSWIKPWQSELLTGEEGDVLLHEPEVYLYLTPAEEIDEFDPYPDYIATESGAKPT